MHVTYTAAPVTCSRLGCRSESEEHVSKKSEKPAGQSLSGKTSDRIRKGEIAADLAFKGNDSSTEPEAKPSSVKGAKGHGLGKGAERRRNGGAS